MTKFYSLLFVSSILLISSCKTASKAYHKGDYTEAVELGVKKLQKDPNDLETKQLVQNSYNYTVNEREDQIRILSNSKNEQRFEQIYQQYGALQHLYEVIHQYPAVAQMIKAKDYSEYVNTYGDKAADIHIERANKWMQDGSKESYREAYKEFSAAYSYRPGDIDLRKRRDDAYDAALTRVIIAPIQNYGGGYQYGSSYQLENFQRDVIRTLSYNMNNQFVKFYTEFEARNKEVVPDQVMELNLSRINIGQPYDNRTSREVSKEVVIKEIVYKPDSVVKQYGTVKATITNTKRTLMSQADLYITVRDTRGRVLWNDRFTGECSWQTEFATYTGDERALSDTDKAQLNQKQKNPPTEDQTMNDLLKKIQDDLTSRLRNYYIRYQ